MIKLQDFARECGVTDRQIHRLLSKYEDEVAGHFERQGQNGTWLDEVACEILGSKMKKLPPAVSDQQMNRDLQKLREENKRLNEMLGAQGIMIGQMHQQIDELQQFKIETIEKRQLLEASREAQEQRERELNQREANMAEEVRIAVQEATEATRAALDKQRDLDVKKAREEAQKASEDAAYLQYQPEIAARDEKIRELESRTFGDYLKGLFRKKDKG